MAASPYQPYCGEPPDPGTVWSHWRLDPTVLILLAAVAIGYGIAYARVRVPDAGNPGLRRRARCFAAGWLLLTLGLVSPLCPLSVALFAARATQHVLLSALAAPLVALGRPLALVAQACAWRGPTIPCRPLPASAAFALAIWLWHLPGPYAATFASTAAYWAMHVTLFTSALWLWRSLLDREAPLVASLFAGTASAMQMGFLGALITLAPHALYPPHFLSTDPWSLSPLQDQQLGGAIMWVVGCSAFFAVAMLGLARVLAPHDARAVRSH